MTRSWPCDHCDAAMHVTVSQTVERDRLAWSVSSACASCGNAEEQCGRDDMPPQLRELLIDQVGLVILQADAETSQRSRTRMLAVFRAGGATIHESVSRYRALTNSGIEGTPAEMKLLADRLTRAGALLRGPEAS
ncbi:hypothetical protein KOI35_36215 [Actinoplanes bogorensis]|uniref:Uncharacterized protein n=1 Tax=Paractinoplanes bogorensis TaxID=1610840 RepID=A0ABS5Z0B5_9ACTN|nr:hypothetical protein [Actinoplanes bogorensis]MBU2668971.1 hypothetical protein [Actinoplanes bogorensis]